MRQIFENRGAMMGSSNPHPQWPKSWRAEHVPNIVASEDADQLAFFASDGRTLSADHSARRKLPVASGSRASMISFVLAGAVLGGSASRNHLSFPVAPKPRSMN
jgi:hypothetical protein